MSLIAYSKATLVSHKVECCDFVWSAGNRNIGLVKLAD